MQKVFVDRNDSDRCVGHLIFLNKRTAQLVNYPKATVSGRQFRQKTIYATIQPKWIRQEQRR